MQLTWTLSSTDGHGVLGAFDSLELTLKADVLKHWFDDFHYDKVEVPNDTALLSSLGLATAF